jgi:hypothetical protein
MVLAPGKHQDDEGGSLLGSGVRQRLEHQQHRLKSRWASEQ